MTDARRSAAVFALGRDAGPLGRWLRLILGIFLLGYLAWDLVIGAPPLGFYGATALYFVAVAGVYLVVHYLLGAAFFARVTPWITTLSVVGPPVMVLVLGLGPDALHLALGLYVAVSLVASSLASYGGCEMVGIPSLVLGRRYTVYCPMNAVDVVDKTIVERKAGFEAREKSKMIR